MSAATRALLSGLIDYAGLFPPAALPMDRAVANHSDYLRAPERWVLNRLVVPARRLDEFAERLGALPRGARGTEPWRVTAIAGTALADDAVAVSAFNARHGGTLARIEAIESVARTPEEAARARAAVPGGLELFLELPLDSDLPALVRAVKLVGAVAKIRTGGVNAADFPAARAVLGFLVACASERLPFKATAGLHHAVRGPAPLTYEPGSARATMFGYLNLFLAAATLWRGQVAERALQLLEDEERAAFQPEGDTLVWRSLRFSADEIGRTRREFALAIGSCSFTEPLEEIRQLGALLTGPS